jgi:hypothetical protein
MSKAEIPESSFHMLDRQLTSGGFCELPAAPYRTDSTAWAILAIREDALGDAVERARSCLAKSQLKDGRVCISDDHPQAFWPTPLSALAWHGSLLHRNNQEQAIQFMLQAAGSIFEKNPNQLFAHDPSLRGWPWIENTFSWVVPTASAILALKLCGYSRHTRVQEAVRLIHDRQLPDGGWNYGNTIVYDQVLLPQPDTTGIALAALSGLVEKGAIEKSLFYLKNEVEHCRTPLSLGWAIIGLSAWQDKPPQSDTWIIESLNLQQTYGVYGTTLLSLLKCAYLSGGDFVEFVASRKA